MANTYTVVTKKDGDWWIGWVEEIPGVNCQEPTHDGLLESLRVTLKEALELNRRRPSAQPRPTTRKRRSPCETDTPASLPA